MEEIVLEHDIEVGYVTAKSFPEGVMAAHKALHELVPFLPERQYFGLSRPENGPIVYRAAAEIAAPGEDEKFGGNKLIIKKGRYVSVMIFDFMKNIAGIGEAFRDLLSNPSLDRQGYCVEWYLNDKDVRCMIRLND